MTSERTTLDAALARPCPFCGNADVQNSVLCTDEGEIEGVYCPQCEAEAPATAWVCRQ